MRVNVYTEVTKMHFPSDYTEYKFPFSISPIGEQNLQFSNWENIDFLWQVKKTFAVI